MKTSVLVLPFLLAAASGASAQGDNAVLLSVTGVTVPGKLPGDCQVQGAVQQVFWGKAFHTGQAVTVKVPCNDGTARLTPAVAVISGTENAHVIAAPILKMSRQGLARLDDAGALIWQAGPYAGHFGPAWGYRVIDGLGMPAR
jgi:hypothetical protein